MDFRIEVRRLRALAIVEQGHAQLISRTGHPFASFADLAQDIGAAVPRTKLTVLDGEVVCVDKKGKPQFRDLLFRRGDPCFFAFDLLMPSGKDALAYSGKVGATIGFLGQGFTSTSTVSFNGTVVKPTSPTGSFLTATVPSGATKSFRNLLAGTNVPPE